MTPSPQCKVLLVDDSFTTRAFMRRAIVLCGIHPDNIYEAENGTQAIALLNKHTVDVVLTDLQMPVMDGEELSRRIFEDPDKRMIPVIIVSADPNEVRIRSLLQGGAKGYLGKPFTPGAFCQALSKVIGDVARA